MLKMMAIEDDVFDMKAIQQIARSFPFIEWKGGFSNIQDALHEMMLNTPDIIIIAVELQEENGLSVASKIQELLPKVPVIVAARNDHHAREAYEVGARGYIIKPFDRVKLLELLGNLRINI
jgi:two-component SAPR family response regulator